MMISSIGWIATAVFSTSYSCKQANDDETNSGTRRAHLDRLWPSDPCRALIAANVIVATLAVSSSEVLLLINLSNLVPGGAVAVCGTNLAKQSPRTRRKLHGHRSRSIIHSRNQIILSLSKLIGLSSGKNKRSAMLQERFSSVQTRMDCSRRAGSIFRAPHCCSS